MPASFVTGAVRFNASFNGCPTIAVLVSRRHSPETGGYLYLVAVPSLPDHPMAQEARDASSGQVIHVRLCEVDQLNLRSFRKTMKSQVPYQLWLDSSDRTPRLDDLERIARDPGALPLPVVARQASDEGAESSSDGEGVSSSSAARQSGQREALARTLESERQVAAQRRRQELQDSAMAQLAASVERISVRLDSMERHQHERPRIATGVADAPVGGAPSARGPSAEADFAELVRGRPTAPLAAPSRRPTADRGPGEARESEGPAPAWAQTLVRAFGEAAAHRDPVPVDSNSARNAKLFKLQGVQGRMAQDILNDEVKTDPGRILREFEQQVERLSPTDPVLGPLGDDGASRKVGSRLLPVWRANVPARDHHLCARLGEALVDIYRLLDAGRAEHAQARTALAICCVEQVVRDFGKWSLRPESLLGLPPCPLQQYGSQTKEAKDAAGKETPLRLLSQLAPPARASTASAVYKENTGA